MIEWENTLNTNADKNFKNLINRGLKSSKNLEETAVLNDFEHTMIFRIWYKRQMKTCLTDLKLSNFVFYFHILLVDNSHLKVYWYKSGHVQEYKLDFE